MTQQIWLLMYHNLIVSRIVGKCWLMSLEPRNRLTKKRGGQSLHLSGTEIEGIKSSLSEIHDGICYGVLFTLFFLHFGFEIVVWNFKADFSNKILDCITLYYKWWLRKLDVVNYCPYVNDQVLDDLTFIWSNNIMISRCLVMI